MNSFAGTQQQAEWPEVVHVYSVLYNYLQQYDIINICAVLDSHTYLFISVHLSYSWYKSSTSQPHVHDHPADTLQFRKWRWDLHRTSGVPSWGWDNHTIVKNANFQAYEFEPDKESLVAQVVRAQTFLKANEIKEEIQLAGCFILSNWLQDISTAEKPSTYLWIARGHVLWATSDDTEAELELN